MDAGNPQAPRYDAFISYSHAANGALAPALQAGLEKILRRWYQLKSFNVFRDQSNLSLHPDLWNQVEEALSRSKHLILLLSPEAAASRWIGDEVHWWLSNRSSESIILVLTAGSLAWDRDARRFEEASTAIPGALAKAIDREPHWLDLSWARDEEGLTLRHARFRDALVSIAARLRGVSKETLDSAAAQTLKVNRRWAVGAAVALSIALAASLVQGWRVGNERILAESRFLQTSAPAEAFLVLEALSRRWLSRTDIGDVPADLMLRPGLAIRREVFPGAVSAAIPVGSGYAVVKPDGGVRISVDRGTWDVEQRTGEDSKPIPAKRIGYFPSIRKLAVLDRDGCLRLASIEAAGAADGGSGCMNGAQGPYGPVAIDHTGRIAHVQHQEIVLRSEAANRPMRLPLRILPEKLVILGANSVLARTEDRRTWLIDFVKGAVSPAAENIVSIGSCRDGAAWMIRDDGKIRHSPFDGAWTKLAGRPPWYVSPGCDRYIDGKGDLYGKTDSKPIVSAVAAGWQYSGNPVKVAFSHDGNRIAVTSSRGPITVYDFASNLDLQTTDRMTLLGHTGRVFSVAFSDDDSRLISSSFDGTLRIFDVSRPLLEAAPVEPVADSIYAEGDGVVFSQEPYIVMEHLDKPIPEPARIKTSGPGPSREAVIPSDWRAGDHFVVLDTDGRKLVLCTTYLCNGGQVVRSWNDEVELSGASGWARASPNGRWIVSVEANVGVKVFDTTRQDTTPVFAFQSAGIRDAAFDRTGRSLFLLHHDGDRLFSVPIKIDELGAAVAKRIRFCLTAAERETYLGEWRWLAERRSRDCAEGLGKH